MQAAEKATGKTAKEIYKLMENGELLAKDFLVPFAKAMSRIVRENNALEKATQKLTSQQHRMNTAYKELVNDIFQKGGGVELFSSIFRDVAEVISSLRPVIVDVFNAILTPLKVIWDFTSSLVGVIIDLSMAFYKLGKSSGALKPLMLLFHGLEVAIYSALYAIEELRMALRGDKKMTFKSAMEGIDTILPHNLAMGAFDYAKAHLTQGAKSTTVGTINITSAAATTTEASRDLADQFLLQIGM